MILCCVDRILTESKMFDIILPVRSIVTVEPFMTKKSNNSVVRLVFLTNS